MIHNSEIIAIGFLLKPHGIKGEITMGVDRDIDITPLRCIVLNIDGIYVPFFIESYRPRSSESILITISGIDSEMKAVELCGKDVFALKDDLKAEATENKDSDGFYLSEFIGYKIQDKNGLHLGIIEDFDDSTENLLLIVKSQESSFYVPIADEFIVDINQDKQILIMDLPDGLINLN